MTLPIQPKKRPVLLPFHPLVQMPPEEEEDNDEPFSDFLEPDVFVPDEEAFPEPGDFWIDDDDWNEVA